MAEGSQSFGRFDWLGEFPSIRLFEAISIALDLKKIALGAAGAWLCPLGISWILFLTGNPPPSVSVSMPSVEEAVASEVEANKRGSAPWLRSLADLGKFPWDHGLPRETGADPYRTPLASDGWRSWLPTSAGLVLEPLRLYTSPMIHFFRDAQQSQASLLSAIWTLLVWAFFGGAITRIAVVQAARGHRIGLGDAVSFTAQRYLSYVGAPVVSMLGATLIAAFCALGGLFWRIPGLDIVASLFWFLSLVAGFVLTVVLFGLAVGWPLMWSAISAEATESFDALSRSYSSVLDHPWSFFWSLVITFVQGAFLFVFAALIAHATVFFAGFAVSWGAGDLNVRSLFAFAPVAGGWFRDFGPDAVEQAPTGTFYYSAVLVGWWTKLFFLALVGFAHSYFWSAISIIYLLLRQKTDDTDFEEVFLDEQAEEPFQTMAPWLTPPPETPAQGERDK